MLLILTFSTEWERDKFEFIFNRYKKLMLHKAFHILNDYSLAEDAASEAFIRIYKNLNKIGDPADAKSVAFIVTVVKNISLTMLRREKGHGAEAFDETVSDGFDLEGRILSQLDFERIYQLLDTMGEEIKGVFLLKYAYGLTHGEIGRMLGIGENNVTVRLHRAKKKLAVLLREEGYASV